MASRVEAGGLRIDERLYRLVRDEIAPGTGVKVDGFWQSLGAIVGDLGPTNRALLAKRDRLQKQIDQCQTRRQGHRLHGEIFKRRCSPQARQFLRCQRIFSQADRPQETTGRNAQGRHNRWPGEWTAIPRLPGKWRGGD